MCICFMNNFPGMLLLKSWNWNENYSEINQTDNVDGVARTDTKMMKGFIWGFEVRFFLLLFFSLLTNSAGRFVFAIQICELFVGFFFIRWSKWCTQPFRCSTMQLFSMFPCISISNSVFGKCTASAHTIFPYISLAFSLSRSGTQFQARI